MHKLIPKVKSSLDRLYENRKKWESLFDECEVQMKKGYNLEKTLQEIDKEIMIQRMLNEVDNGKSYSEEFDRNKQTYEKKNSDAETKE